MLVDGKYHIASLVAVFLALGLGVLIGITAFRDDTLVRRQESIIANLEKQFATLESERRALQEQIDSLQERNAQYAAFAEGAREFFVGGQLEGRKLALVVSDQVGSQAEKAILKLLADAKAHVSGIWYLQGDWISDDWKHRAELERFADQLSWPAGRFKQRLAAGLARQLIVAPESDVVTQLEEWDVVAPQGLTGDPSDTAVFLGPQTAWEGSQHRAQLAIMDAVSDLEAGVVAVNSDSWAQTPEELEKREIPTVEGVTDEVGQVVFVQTVAKIEPPPVTYQAVGAGGQQGVSAGIESLSKGEGD